MAESVLGSTVITHIFLSSMEQVILLNRLEDLKYLKDKYKRVYFGNEFCARLLPDTNELKEIIKTVEEKGLKFTFITPQVGSKDLKIVKSLLRFLNKNFFLKEVVVNDYGVLNYINKNFPESKIILGRMLSFFSNGRNGSYLNKLGIGDFEFDNIGHIYNREFKSISFYYPYALLSNTRYCPVTNNGMVGCSKECLGAGELMVKGLDAKNKITLFGNTLFYRNKIKKDLLKDKRIIRLIFIPKAPL